jgi:copper chaperone CopZ
METLTLELPAMYGDHHVVEVRRILFELPGVTDVYASSGFHVVEVSYDPKQIGEDGIKAALDKAGYLGDLQVPFETGIAATARGGNGNGTKTYFRHTAAYEATHVVSFAQKVTYAGRPLWPCPGLGPISAMDEGE